MSVRERVEYERKKARLITAIREEVAVCGLAEVEIQVDRDRTEVNHGNHRVNISNPAVGTIEFEVAAAWFDCTDSRNDGNLRFATRQAIRALSR
jgi:hypothetical protein